MVGNKIFNVKNRSASIVVYKIPEENIRREFAPGESKKISYAELEKLTYQPGGRELMANFLQIDSDEAINEVIETTPNEGHVVVTGSFYLVDSIFKSVKNYSNEHYKLERT